MAGNRNRKRVKSVAVFPAPLAGVLFVVCMLALTYLWLDGRCDALGLRIKDLEKRNEALHRAIVNEEYKWAHMTSPQNMQNSLKAHGLVMDWPQEKNIVRVRRPSSSDAPVLAHHVYAQNSGTVVND